MQFLRPDQSVMSFCAVSAVAKQVNQAIALLEQKEGCDDVKASLQGTFDLLSKINPYAEQKSSPMSPFLTQVMEDTAALDFEGLAKEGKFKTKFPVRGGARMLSPPAQVCLLRFLVQKSNAKNILEVGTFTGYAAFGMAEVMAPGGKVTGIELETFFCDFVNDRAKKNNLNVEVKEGEAIPVLKALAESGVKYDLIYIDCVKTEYYEYYKIIMDNDMLSSDGTIVCDNVLWLGKAITRADDSGKAVDDFSTAVSQDKRVTSVFLPCYDGLLLIQPNKKS